MYIRVILYKVCNKTEHVLLKRDEFEVENFNFEVDAVIDSFKRDGCDVSIKVNRSIDGYYIYVTIGDIYYGSVYDNLMRLSETVFMNSISDKLLEYF